MPDDQAICIDSEEEAAKPCAKAKAAKAAKAKSRRRRKVPVDCIDLDLEVKVDALAVCLSSSDDEEAPKKRPRAKPKAKSPKAKPKPVTLQVDDDGGLEKRAEELAAACLRGLKPEVRAARIAKVKHSILARLREAACEPERPAPEKEAEPDEPEQPPPPPPEERVAQQQQQPQQPQQPKWVDRSQRQLQHLLRAEQYRLGGESLQEEVERNRLAEREKRKALWSSGVPEASEGRSANGWETSHFQSDKERLKFLRLMGGQKFVDAALALEGELDDEKVFELIAGEWVEAKDDEDFDVREDAATVELMAGEWVDVAKEPTHGEREQDLERQYLEGMSRQLGSKRMGLGA